MKLDQWKKPIQQNGELLRSASFMQSSSVPGGNEDVIRHNCACDVIVYFHVSSFHLRSIFLHGMAGCCLCVAPGRPLVEVPIRGQTGCASARTLHRTHT